MLALFSLFMVWMNLFASFDNRVRHCLFLGFIILFVFILYPAKKGTQKVNHIPGMTSYWQWWARPATLTMSST